MIRFRLVAAYPMSVPDMAYQTWLHTPRWHQIRRIGRVGNGEMFRNQTHTHAHFEHDVYSERKSLALDSGAGNRISGTN
eukprot:1891793-Rhodomonas_salina.5